MPEFKLNQQKPIAKLEYNVNQTLIGIGGLLLGTYIMLNVVVGQFEYEILKRTEKEQGREYTLKIAAQRIKEESEKTEFEQIALFGFKAGANFYINNSK
jgi:hypothetical protein